MRDAKEGGALLEGEGRPDGAAELNKLLGWLPILLLKLLSLRTDTDTASEPLKLSREDSGGGRLEAIESGR